MKTSKNRYDRTDRIRQLPHAWLAPVSTRRMMPLARRLLLMALAGTLLLAAAGCSAPAKASGATTITASTTTVAPAAAATTTDPDQPARTVDLYGRVKTIQGNVMVVDILTNPATTGETLTAEQKAAKQAAMQALSEEERAKAKAASQAPTGESVTVLIPVGIPIKSKASQLDGGLIKPVAMTAIVPGSLVSVWTEDSAKSGKVNAEYVRISAA